MVKRLRNNSKQAFTLIELSAIIIIISILIAGVMTATGLVKKSKIAAAQSLTKSSPIGGIQDNALWLESSAESSFKDTETSTGDAVTTWYDQKNAVNKSSVVAVGTGPTYSNTINYIHAVRFVGSGTNYLQIADASFLNNTDYTIVVLEKRQSASAGYFIGDSSVSTANQTLLLGYSADAAIAHSQGTGNAYTSNISTYSSSSDTPRVFTFISDSVNGKKTYINGILAAQSSDTTKLSNITTLAIGKGYTGEIGEIAIFTRALKADERKTTEDYLGKKYSTKVNRNTIASGSCINGVVTTNGCTMDCSTASVTGLSSPSTVSDGASGVTGTCGTTGYAGTVTLGCSSGTGVLSASPTICGCDTFGGYSSSGGVCIADCSYTLTGGSPTTGTVSAGTAILNCNTASHYSSSGYTYTCSGGAAITATCACATGYTESGCSTCDSANNYISSGGGTCALGCTIPTGSGTSTTLVAVGSTSVTCDSAGFTGNLTYTCSSGGSAIAVGTACSATSTNYFVLSTGTSITVPSGYTQAKIWAVGAGGGGGGATQSDGTAGGGGGAGGVAYKTWTVSSGNVISYAIGTAGSGGYSTGNGTSGGNTTVTFNSVTITGNGGSGGNYNSAIAATGGSFSGGDGGAAGGGSIARSGDIGGSSGGGVGGVTGTQEGYRGAVGVNSADVSSMHAAVVGAGVAIVSGGAGADDSGPGGTKPGGPASGFGCSGGGAGWYGGNGGAGKFGGGGGGAAGLSSPDKTGGAGGSGAVVIKFF
ncbi:MAG: hypothetical protein V4694_01735 [Pseudomonadota bacterium]